jgi:hypothetical protein
LRFFKTRIEASIGEMEFEQSSKADVRGQNYSRCSSQALSVPTIVLESTRWAQMDQHKKLDPAWPEAKC